MKAKTEAIFLDAKKLHSNEINHNKPNVANIMQISPGIEPNRT